LELCTFEELRAAADVDFRAGLDEETTGVVEGEADGLEEATDKLCNDDEDGIEMTVDENVAVEASEMTVVEEISTLVGELDGVTAVEGAPDDPKVGMNVGVVIEDDDAAGVYGELEAACDDDAAGVYAGEVGSMVCIMLEPRVVVSQDHSVIVSHSTDVIVTVLSRRPKPKGFAVAKENP
jgi:hypothetical protein